jgi:hypothetical protein
MNAKSDRFYMAISLDALAAEATCGERSRWRSLSEGDTTPTRLPIRSILLTHLLIILNLFVEL